MEHDIVKVLIEGNRSLTRVLLDGCEAVKDVLTLRALNPKKS